MSTSTVVTYEPRGAVKALLTDRSPEVLLSGSAGTGKTMGVLWKLNLQALKYPGMRGLIVRKSQTSLASSALETWRKHVIPELLATGAVTYYGGSSVEPAQYRYANGSKILVGGMDKASKILSIELDVAVVVQAEELTEDDWETLTTRLRNNVMPYQQIIADCNPDRPTHWLKQRADRGQLVMHHSRHTDNPRYHDGSDWTDEGRTYIAKLDSLSGVRYLRLRKGEWAGAEGLISTLR